MVPNHQAVMADRHVDNVNVYRLNPVDMVEPGKWILQDEKQFDHVKLNVNIIIYIYIYDNMVDSYVRWQMSNKMSCQA